MLSGEILLLLFVLGNFKTNSHYLNATHKSSQNLNSQDIETYGNKETEEKIMMHSYCGSKTNKIRYKKNKYDTNPINKTFTTLKHRSNRQKRDASAFHHNSDPNEPYTIEVLVVVDEAMRKFHRSTGSDIKEYVLSLMSSTADLFADASIGNMINIAVVGIINLDKDLNVNDLHDGKNAERMLWNFQEYMNNKPKNREYDVGLLLTREKLCLNKKCETMGLAAVGGMCSSQSYAIVEDSGLSTGYTIAHEFGHLLNANHDEENVCSELLYNMQLHVMAAISRSGNKMWSWSPCSRHFITQFLEDEKGFCLLNKPLKNMLESYSIDIQNSSPNRQCQMAYGSTSKAISFTVKYDFISCIEMRCQIEHPMYMPWADGTECGSGKQCHRGECVELKKLGQIDGRWSEWKIIDRFQCTRPCGGGIQWYSRECNNPIPKNGRYCVGRHQMYKSCNTEGCPVGTMDTREKQCQDINNSWTAAYNVYPKDQCKLACKNKNTKKISWPNEKVIDGTPCSQNTFDKCINGICRSAGCDNKLNSKLKLNKCGVCYPSDEICEHYTETYSAKQIRKLNKNEKYPNYFSVTKIPKGAANIQIIQFGHRGDGNYIVLEDEQGKLTRFIDEPFIDITNAIYPYDGLEFEYNSNSTMVKVDTLPSKSLLRELSIKMLLVGESKGDLIYYSYWIKNKYHMDTVIFDAVAQQHRPKMLTLLSMIIMLIYLY